MSWLKRKSVLIPIDFSELSYQALGPAKELADDISSLQLIHVLAPLYPADPAAMWDTISDEDRKQKVRSFTHNKLGEMGYGELPIEVVIGDPTSKIVDYAQEIDADLIVMPSHGRKGVSRFLIGSVAEQVVRLSHCPVLILK
ncbi:universal stress protein [Leptolyngbya cf. ectocarpi LEGE 11479]|uniref:Universal stress protein n=1 Tax=Leptolyngbya cf. ectocarpi LEGE 11479 TaxID=1828722 RepID=A0A928ZSB6_LEPEC|nr:universal stress protein [Leptolyngbya ectocarpi]MBE9065967.1 universal stress protein [Leptolyngbya cf. ectocarpi LEGE 11479]